MAQSPNRSQVPVPAIGMNKWESDYAERLTLMAQAGEIQGYMFECIKLRLANRCWYTPDFMVLTNTGRIELHEVKGFWRDDAKVKTKGIAEQFQSLYTFVIVTRSKGHWEFEEMP